MMELFFTCRLEIFSLKVPVVTPSDSNALPMALLLLSPG
jgi:hypothetical protein